MKKTNSSFESEMLEEEGQAIIDAIKDIKEQLELTKHKFDHTTDDILIDSYIYEISALNLKYQYFLRLAKQLGLVADGFFDISPAS